MVGWANLQDSYYGADDLIRIWAADDTGQELMLLDAGGYNMEGADGQPIAQGGWRKYSASLYGFSTVAMRFGFQCDSSYSGKSWFDHFQVHNGPIGTFHFVLHYITHVWQVLGDGPDRSSLLCADGCAAGTYRISGMDSCMPCSAGTADTDSVAWTACETCLAGQYSLNGQMECLSCAAGSFSPVGSTSADSCILCPAGQYDADGSASTPCVNCPSGRFSTQQGQLQ